jgi:hypothetical protein
LRDLRDAVLQMQERPEDARACMVLWLSRHPIQGDELATLAAGTRRRSLGGDPSNQAWRSEEDPMPDLRQA